MNLVTYEPKTYLDRIFDTDPFFNDFWSWSPMRDRRAAVDRLRVNVIENPDNYTLTAEVPGFAEKDIELEIKDGQMTLKGRAEVSGEKEDTHYRMKEFSCNSFERSFRIGEGVDLDKVTAKLASGILTVVLPKKEEVKPKTVKVEIGS
ncbi:MAG: Hsp20 family protein [Nitrospinaceae bacterium]|nr:Hsp20/alpha crystallin family protein [Nitrospinaceae bacterium]NIR53582.1 Hsp20/alpha crystallin family protein [Nitrospinaceae bacterium]NIS83983.1 Hsp20/alpha crystallin family protein [Nitrospinaceae bacterium]NIT80792.1 Hsp20/alpha crystallin family protein [Nitrospinaceae bacterium]NIU43098.1 Hsp20/alpha crystallin family protein [Nitrospinaceae bacterium]